MTRIANITRARLTQSFLEPRMWSGRIHSKYQSTLNIQLEEKTHKKRLLTLVPDTFPGIPDSLQLAKTDFDWVMTLPQDTQADFKQDTLSFKDNLGCLKIDRMALEPDRYDQVLSGISVSGSWPANLDRWVQFMDTFQENGAQRDGFSHLPRTSRERAERHLAHFCRALFAYDYEKAESHMLSVVGLGAGLTPTADDRIVGIMALVCAIQWVDQWSVNKREHHAGLTNWGLSSPDSICAGRTTDVSMKYLTCAAEGYFSERLMDLVRAILEGTDQQWPQRARSVASIGATSGCDYLQGITAACRYYPSRKRHLSSERRSM
jgi:hypothetical protein